VRVIGLDGMIEMTAARCRWRPRDMASTPFYIRVEGANLRLSIDIEREVSTIKRAGLPSVGRDRGGPALTGGSP
jgi:hypothetical protein